MKIWLYNIGQNFVLIEFTKATSEYDLYLYIRNLSYQHLKPDFEYRITFGFV